MLCRACGALHPASGHIRSVCENCTTDEKRGSVGDSAATVAAAGAGLTWPIAGGGRHVGGESAVLKACECRHYPLDHFV